MAIIETKADQLLSLIDRAKTITTADAAKELGVTEVYVRTIATALQRNALIGIKASAFSMTLMSKAAEE